ncbi:MAG: MmcQ/YjbR family DNA-binding protein [Candidatus Limnocylindria bacterium]
MATWDDVCAILAELPGVEIAPPGGERVARVKGARLAFVAENERSRPPQFGADEVLAVRTEYPTRAALIAEDPDLYGVTPHYETYPAVLVRLPGLSTGELRELLTDGWRIIAPKRLVRQLDVG